MDDFVLSNEEAQRIAAACKGTPLGPAEIKAAELADLYGLIRTLCGSWTKRFSVGGQRTRCVLVESTAGTNAWAWDLFGGPREHVVVFQTNLLDSIGRHAGQVERLVELAVDSNQEDLFRQVWGQLPNDAPHREAFAQLLLHVAVAFLTLHEMAHIALNHREFYLDKPADMCAMDECSRLDEEWSASNLRAHALELDADIHALAWLLEHLDTNTSRLRQDDISGDQAVGTVWNHFVGTASGIRFLIICGAWLALLNVGARKFHPHQLKSGTHPPGAMRMAVLLHLENAENGRKTKASSTHQVAAADFALSLYTLVSLTESRLAKMEQEGLDAAITPIREPLEVAKRNSGLAGVLANWDAVGKAATQLAAERASIEQTMASRRRVPAGYCVGWFTDSDEESG